MTDNTQDRDRYAHLTGDYYIDREAHSPWLWLGGSILLLVLPPVGAFILGSMLVSSLTTDPNGEEGPDT
jgi:hypothetical protein